MQRTRSRVLIAALTVVLSLPLSAQAVVRSEEFRLLGDIQRNAAITDYHTTDRKILRRAYTDAMEAFRERVRYGDTDALRPDFNDPSTYREFLPDAAGVDLRSARRTRLPGRVEPPHAAAPARSSVLERTDLSVTQRTMLRAYIRAGACPPSMEKILSGFYQLCRAMVGADASEDLPTSVQSDVQRIRAQGAAPRPTLKLRMEMLRQARDRTNRRSDGTGHLRPMPYTGE